MKLMLGQNNNPVLLVTVDGQFSGIGEFNENNFDFWVHNGAWSGIYTNGFVTVLDCPSGSFSDLEKMEILTDNQDRLRGSYEDVFANWSNPNYVAPKPKEVVNVFDDDDTPF